MGISETNSPPVLTWKLRAILLGAGLIFSLIALEVAFRLSRGLVKSTPWSDRPYAYFLLSDAHTLQDSDPHPKDPGVFRIAVVGDSFTFGPHIQLGDTFPKRLEQMLNLNRGAPRVEVLNRGVCGASTAVEVELVRRALSEGPNLLVLEITLNDAEPHLLSKAEHEALFKPSWLRWKIFEVWRSLGFVAVRIQNWRSARRYAEYHTHLFKNPRTLDVFRTSLARIGLQARSAGIPVVAMVSPLFDYPVNGAYPFHEVHNIIGQALATAGIPKVDLRSAFPNIPVDRLQVIPGVDSHPNEIAHRIVAEYLLAVLVRDRLIPMEVVPQRVFRERKDLRSISSKPGRIFAKAAGMVLATTPGTSSLSVATGEHDGEGEPTVEENADLSE